MMIINVIIILLYMYTILPCTDALAFSHGGQFGQGNGSIIERIDCSGSELKLIDCRITEYSGYNCIHAEDAGVRCCK